MSKSVLALRVLQYLLIPGHASFTDSCVGLLPSSIRWTWALGTLAIFGPPYSFYGFL